MRVGPGVFVDEHAAAWLAIPLATWARGEHAAGHPLPHEVLAIVTEIDRAGAIYRHAHDPRSADGTHGTPNGAEDRTAGAEHATVTLMTTSEVAKVLDRGPRNVTALASRGSLRGHQKGRRWFFDPIDVEEHIAARNGGNPDGQ